MRDMSGLRILGIILVVLGALALAYQKFSYKKEHELFRIGETAATVTTTETKRVPPWVGFALVGGGLILLILPKKK